MYPSVFLFVTPFFFKMSGLRVYVGGLSWDTTNDTLKQFFEGCGTVTDAFIVQDRETGRSKGSCFLWIFWSLSCLSFLSSLTFFFFLGFGFVTFEVLEDAQKSVAELNNQELDGRTIRVDTANDRPERSTGGGYGGSGGDRNAITFLF